MDISAIKKELVTGNFGIKLGDKAAPKKLTVFLNLRCPYCKKFWLEHSSQIMESLKKGQLQLVIQLFNKEKESLKSGNVMHDYISYTQPERAFLEITAIFKALDSWKNLPLEEVANFAETTLKLSPHENEANLHKIVHEASEAQIVLVPTAILGEHIFDEHISKEELQEMIDE